MKTKKDMSESCPYIKPILNPISDQNNFLLCPTYCCLFHLLCTWLSHLYEEDNPACYLQVAYHFQSELFHHPCRLKILYTNCDCPEYHHSITSDHWHHEHLSAGYLQKASFFLWW